LLSVPQSHCAIGDGTLGAEYLFSWPRCHDCRHHGAPACHADSKSRASDRFYVEEDLNLGMRQRQRCGEIWSRVRAGDQFGSSMQLSQQDIRADALEDCLLTLDERIHIHAGEFMDRADPVNHHVALRSAKLWQQRQIICLLQRFATRRVTTSRACRWSYTPPASPCDGQRSHEPGPASADTWPRG
jgi:hypothetical protein